MDYLADALWIELRKATRSRMPLFTALAFLLAPVVGAFFMIVLRDPARARSVGLISAKAQLAAGTADWPSYLALLAQATALGGFMLFSFVASWVFGREFVDGTLKDLLAVPVARSTIVLAKFIVVVLWSLALVALICVVGLGLGVLIGLPQGSPAVLLGGGATIAVTAAMTVALVTPIALLAGVGRGYLLPLGSAVLLVVLGQVLAVAGWGSYFPWDVPGLYAGVAGDLAAALGPASYLLVIVTALAGAIGTWLWWQLADQSR